MKDKLLFGTIGLLVGIVVMQWTMPNGQANVSVPSSGIISIEDNNDWLLMLDQNGHAWTSQLSRAGTEPRCWNRVPEWDPPVPVSNIKFWTTHGLVTTDNHAWVAEEPDPGALQLTWHDCGPWPGASVSSNQSTIGNVKSQYRPKGDKP